MLDLQGFRDMFAEFQAVGDSLIETALIDAAERVSPGVYGKLINRAHGLMAAHIMTASSNWGQSARLDQKLFPGKTTYSRTLDEIMADRASMRGIT